MIGVLKKKYDMFTSLSNFHCQCYESYLRFMFMIILILFASPTYQKPKHFLIEVGSKEHKEKHNSHASGHSNLDKAKG